MVVDNDPHRRNFIVTSVAFLAYFWGGGELKDDAITLSFLSIEFHNPTVLVIMAWCALGWFSYRFALSRDSGYLSALRRDTVNLSTDRHRLRYIKKPLIEERNRQFPRFDKNQWEGISTTNTFNEFFKSRKIRGRSKYIPHNDYQEFVYKPDKWKARYIKARLLIDSAIRHEKFANNIFPWVLFGLVLLSGYSTLLLWITEKASSWL